MPDIRARWRATQAMSVHRRGAVDAAGGVRKNMIYPAHLTADGYTSAGGHGKERGPPPDVSANSAPASRAASTSAPPS